MEKLGRGGLETGLLLETPSFILNRGKAKLITLQQRMCLNSVVENTHTHSSDLLEDSERGPLGCLAGRPRTAVSQV